MPSSSSPSSPSSTDPHTPTPAPAPHPPPFTHTSQAVTKTTPNVPGSAPLSTEMFTTQLLPQDKPPTTLTMSACPLLRATSTVQATGHSSHHHHPLLCLGRILSKSHHDAQAYVWKQQQNVFVAFRGSSSSEDFYTDLQLRLHNWKDVRVHTGP